MNIVSSFLGSMLVFIVLYIYIYMEFNGQIIWKVLSYTGLYPTQFAPYLVQCWKRYGLNDFFLRLSAWSEGLGQYLEKFFNLFRCFDPIEGCIYMRFCFKGLALY
jgi:hypothetical protein